MASSVDSLVKIRSHPSLVLFGAYNEYAYAGNNPVTNIYPNGQNWFSILLRNISRIISIPELPGIGVVVNVFTDPIEVSSEDVLPAVTEGTVDVVQKTNSISKNIENLRGWAQSKGWVRQDTAGRVEQWGVHNSEGQFSWRLKIKPEVSNRPGLGAGSQQPRINARLAEGQFINPFTGETGGRGVGTHIPLG